MAGSPPTSRCARAPWRPCRRPRPGVRGRRLQPRAHSSQPAWPGARGFAPTPPAERVPPTPAPMLSGMPEELKPAYLIAGSDRPKVDRTVARLRARFDAEATEVLSAADTSGEDAVAACNVMGLFGAGTRLVVIEGVEAWKAPDAKAVAAYLKAPAPGTTLALVAGELKKDAPLAKAVAAKGELLIWDVVMKAVARWIAEQFKLHKTKVEPEACRLLANLVGDDLYE